MRLILVVAGAAMVSGCAQLFPSRADHGCDQASHALRVHDSKIEAARASGAMGFTATLVSRSYATYHCVTTSGDQIACHAIREGEARAQTARMTRLMRERSMIENRVARSCQI